MTLASALTIDEVILGTGGRLRTPAVRHQAPLPGVSIDSRTIQLGQVFFAIAGERFDGHAFLAEVAARGAAAAVVHRDVPAPEGLPIVRVGDTTRALADLARHWRLAAGIPVVVITGSLGKTTTKDMTAALLALRGPVLKTEGNLNNQYGLPLTLLRLRPEHATAVLELGMSAAGELRALSAIAQPDLAVITKVAPVHLEFFASIDAIAEAKAEVLDGLRADGVAVLNGDDPRVRRMGEGRRNRIVWFGRDRRYDVSAENVRGTPFGMRFDLRVGGQSADVALPLPGPHFVSNFLAAAAVAHVQGISPEAIAEAATHLVAARHRGEVRRLGEGITLIDDCYNSSPDALAAAVVTLAMAPGPRRVAVLGDMLELGPTGPALHHEQGVALAGTADVVVGVGPIARHFLEGARSAGFLPSRLHHFDDSAGAAAALPAIVEPGDAVLVKGSRGIRLEAVVDALIARFPESGS
ncbi:MAG: UDP-N-acetylmuramoyl-tripeptide--D-alanyl-D-alanine ligase [Solirubrobacterales bacterium]